MRLLIIRHAQSANNAAFLEGAPRVEDPELTELGVRQAHHLGTMLATLPAPGADSTESLGWRPSVLYTSLMLRAVSTSAILARHTGAAVVGREDIHETGGIYLDDPSTGEPHGLLGTTREEFHARFPVLELPESAGPRGWWSRPHETEPQVIERAERASAWLLGLRGDPRAEAGTVGLVTHGGFFEYLVPRLLGLAATSGFHLDVRNTGCTLLELTPDERRLVFHNRTCHLPVDAVS